MIQIHISSFIFSVSRASEENFSRRKEKRDFIRRATLLDQHPTQRHNSEKQLQRYRFSMKINRDFREFFDINR